jgi:hypothetical protein
LAVGLKYSLLKYYDTSWRCLPSGDSLEACPVLAVFLDELPDFWCSAAGGTLKTRPGSGARADDTDGIVDVEDARDGCTHSLGWVPAAA